MRPLLLSVVSVDRTSSGGALYKLPAGMTHSSGPHQHTCIQPSVWWSASNPLPRHPRCVTPPQGGVRALERQCQQRTAWPAVQGACPPAYKMREPAPHLL
jgi:hypothetical protein